MGPAPADVLSFLGLAHRAGSVARGVEAVRRALQRGEAGLVLIAVDSSPVQREKVLRILRHREVPWAFLGRRSELGRAVGSGPLSAVAITASSFARQIAQRVPEIRESGRSPDHRR